MKSAILWSTRNQRVFVSVVVRLLAVSTLLIYSAKANWAPSESKTAEKGSDSKQRQRHRSYVIRKANGSETNVKGLMEKLSKVWHPIDTLSRMDQDDLMAGLGETAVEARTLADGAIGIWKVRNNYRLSDETNPYFRLNLAEANVLAM